MDATAAPEPAVPPDPFEMVRKRIARKLEGFSSDYLPESDDWDHLVASRPDRRDFPVPELVLMALRDVMGFRWSGHGEKVRWSVYCTVVDEPVVFEFRKFGFTLLMRKDSTVKQSRVEGQVKAAVRVLEGFLESYAEELVNLGHVTINNHFTEFDARYRFFRGLADKAYAHAKVPPAKAETLSTTKGDISGLLDGWNHKVKGEREGFFYSTAMVDSFFSCLEHRLVLLRAFKGDPLGRGEFLQLLAAKWDEKLKLVLDVAGNHTAEVLLGRMRRIKERIRNPFAHGGVENDGGSLFVHMPNVGAIPANLTRFADSIRFSFIPIEADDHTATCAVFDELDAMLQTGPLAGPHELLTAGVDPAFDAKTLQGFADAVNGGGETLEHFIDWWGNEWMRHTNMDY